MSSDLNRRDFVGAGVSTLAVAWMTANLAGIRDAARHAARATADGRLAFETLAPDDAADLAALAEQIIPGEPGSPGAREAGVIHFIDRALGTFASAFEPGVRQGLADINGLVANRSAIRVRFAGLSPAQQESLMPEIAALPAFGLVRTLVVSGMFADPSYGGNRDKIGWKLLGFDDRFAWQPPFGYYDREAHGGR